MASYCCALVVITSRIAYEYDRFISSCSSFLFPAAILFGAVFFRFDANDSFDLYLFSHFWVVFSKCNVGYMFARDGRKCCVFDEYDDALMRSDLVYRLEYLRCRMVDWVSMRLFVFALNRVFRCWRSVIECLQNC